MHEFVVLGSPRRFDAVLRPFARVFQLGVAGLLTLVLAWFEQWWWLPVPLVISFLLYEAFFAMRGDKPVRVHFNDSGVVVEDRKAGRRLAVDKGDIRAASLLYRVDPDDPAQLEIATVWSGSDGPLLALSTRVPRDGFTPAPGDLDVDAMDRLLGGLAGLVRSLAPTDRAGRQIVRDARPLEWYREVLPEEVRSRTAIRLWQGAAPALDRFGHLVGEPDAMLFLEGQRGRLRASAGESDLRLRVSGVSRAQREVSLFTIVDGRPTEVVHDLPLLVIGIEGLGSVALPAPLVDPDLPECSLDEQAWHLHGPEGALLLSHLLRHDLAHDPALPGFPALDSSSPAGSPSSRT